MSLMIETASANASHFSKKNSQIRENVHTDDMKESSPILIKIKETVYKPKREYSQTQTNSNQFSESFRCENSSRYDINPTSLLEKLQKDETLMLIDTREIRKYKTGHIEGAESMNCTSRSMMVKTKKCLKSFVEKCKHHTIVIYNEKGERNVVLDDFIEFVKSQFLIVYFLIGGYDNFLNFSNSKFITTEIPEEEYEQHHFSPTNESNRSANVLHATMTQILPFLFLGNEMDSNDLEILKEKNITHILNVTNTVPNYHENSFKYERLCASDSNKQNMRAHYEKATTFIEEARKTNGKVLVHCWAGVSRSATIVAAYLLKHTNLNVLEVVNFLQSRRSIVEPNFNFLGQLERFYLDLEAGVEERSAVFQDVQAEAKRQAELLEKLRLSSNSSSSDNCSPPTKTKIFVPFFK